MKCSWCGSKVGSEHRKDGSWVRGENTGQGYFQCPQCNKSSIHRYEMNPIILLPLFVVGAVSSAIPYAVAFLLVEIYDFSYGIAFGAGVVVFLTLIVSLWLYSFQPLHVKVR